MKYVAKKKMYTNFSLTRKIGQATKSQPWHLFKEKEAKPGTRGSMAWGEPGRKLSPLL